MNQTRKADYNKVVAQYNLMKQLKEEMEADPVYLREAETQETVVNTRSYNTVSQPPISVGEASVNVVGIIGTAIFLGFPILLIGATQGWW